MPHDEYYLYDIYAENLQISYLNFIVLLGHRNANLVFIR